MFLSTKALEKSKGGVATHKSDVFMAWSWRGVLYPPGYAQGSAGWWFSLGRAGWSVVIYIKPGGKRTDQSQGGKQKFSIWAGKSWVSHPLWAHTLSLSACTHPEELSRLLCGFYHLHPPGIKHWAKNSPPKPLKPSMLLKNFSRMKNSAGEAPLLLTASG